MSGSYKHTAKIRLKRHAVATARRSTKNQEAERLKVNKKDFQKKEGGFANWPNRKGDTIE